MLPPGSLAGAHASSLACPAGGARSTTLTPGVRLSTDLAATGVIARGRRQTTNLLRAHALGPRPVCHFQAVFIHDGLTLFLAPCRPYPLLQLVTLLRGHQPGARHRLATLVTHLLLIPHLPLRLTLGLTLGLPLGLPLGLTLRLTLRPGLRLSLGLRLLGLRLLSLRLLGLRLLGLRLGLRLPLGLRLTLGLRLARLWRGLLGRHQARQCHQEAHIHKQDCCTFHHSTPRC